MRNYIIAAVILAATVIVFQNREVVDTRLLFVTVSMPRALLLFSTLVLGVVAGLLLGNHRRAK